MNEKLKEGFNPFTAIKREAVSDGRTLSNQFKTVFSESCLDANNEQKRTYTTVYNRFKKFLDNDEYKSLKMSQVDIDTAQAFKTFLIRQKLAKKTVNSTHSHIGLFWDKGMEIKMATTNPFRIVPKVKRQRRDEGGEDVFEPLAFEELDRVIQYFQLQKHQFSSFLINDTLCMGAAG